MWDLADRSLRRTLEGHSGLVKCVAFSRRGQWLASGGVDATFRLWDAATGESRQQTTAHANTVYSLSFAPDDRKFVSASFDRTLRVWAVDAT
jgi:WD40 repeat protein